MRFLLFVGCALSLGVYSVNSLAGKCYPEEPYGVCNPNRFLCMNAKTVDTSVIGTNAAIKRCVADLVEETLKKDSKTANQKVIEVSLPFFSNRYQFVSIDEEERVYRGWMLVQVQENERERQVTCSVEELRHYIEPQAVPGAHNFSTFCGYIGEKVFELQNSEKVILTERNN